MYVSRKNVTRYIDEFTLVLLQDIKSMPTRDCKLLSNMYPSLKPILIGKFS